MAVTTTNIIQGPADVYYGAFGAAEPADTLSALQGAPASPTWLDAGGTTDGVNLTVAQEFNDQEVDQVVEVVGRRITKREFQVETNLAETTLENLQLLLNGGTIVPLAGYKKYHPAAGTDGKPVYKSFILDGIAPNYLRRRIIARKVLNVDDVEMAYSKEDQSVYSVTLGTHYVSKTILSYDIIDEDPNSVVTP